MENGTFAFNYEYFSLKNLLKECICNINMEAKSKNVKMDLNFDDCIPDIILSD